MTLQCELPFPLPPQCWLVAFDKVRKFHYVIEGETVGVTLNGRHTVRRVDDNRIVVLPIAKIYPTKIVAVNRLLECERD